MNQAKCAICKEFTIDPITGFKTCKCEVKEVTVSRNSNTRSLTFPREQITGIRLPEKRKMSDYAGDGSSEKANNNQSNMSGFNAALDLVEKMNKED